ncbi:MAG: hypothetical protein K1X28_01465 [Parachlamydiales bacterium]|nr:hypothetical protein [Parachlamydiales bacterium]
MSTFRIWKDRFDAIRLYYKRPKFALIDLSFGLLGLFMNPYRTCRKFLQKRGEENIYAYGETPYTTYEKIAKECGIGPNDTWIELGAGRGKGCFWLNHFTGCKVIGVEWVPSFVYFAKLLKRLFRIKNVQFECIDIKKADLSGATVIYLYGLWLDLKIPKGAKVITTGEPLYSNRVLKSFWVRFPWGRTTAYLQEIE